MDRELVFAILAPALCGAALTAAGWWLPAGSLALSTQQSESRMWWRIWLPFGPAVLVFALLCGWLLVEPRDAEPAPKVLILTALPFGLIFLRAGWRAARSLSIARAQYTIATVGLFRPRIILSSSLADALDPRAMAAALEHERAHLRHRDPLRIWLANLGAELQWPAPAAGARLQAWKAALEMARDDEARSQGAPGPDLAAAILASLRVSRTVPRQAAAQLTDETFVKERVTRLLQPLEAPPTPESGFAPTLIALSLAIGAAVLLGIKFGERLIGSLLTGA